MFYHMSALALGCALDLIIGDPYNIPHPIRWIGSLIAFLEKKMNAGKSHAVLKARGLILVIMVMIIPAGLCAAIMFLAYGLNVYVGVAAEAVITCYMLAGKSLYNESMKVYRALAAGDVEGARKAVSMIVGRDTEKLDEEGITKAAVETVAENTSDGVIAPLLYLAIGGPVLGILYKSINTMDSMIGYKNEKYKDFGFFAAKFDDVFNFVPARISAFLMMIATLFAGRDFSFKGAVSIFFRDRYNHASPNSAQCESVCAGALGVRLAGDASYFGKVVHKPFIGDKTREIEPRDIQRANRLMFLTGILTFIVCEMVLLLIMQVRGW